MPGAPRSRVVLGVAGGIAAYKACSLLRLLVEVPYDVRVVPTESALRFVGEATWAALSHQPVHTAVWDDVHEVPHVRLGREADLVVVAPATADLLAKAAHGQADDLLTSTLLTARCPVVFAPAMHTEMWDHPATRANVATLRERGALVLEPAEGRLTGTDTGKGRLPEPEQIFDVCRGVLARGAEPLVNDLTGRHVVVSAGGTREYLDPVRYLGNRSSGRQGYALARTAVLRGASVTLVAANVSLPDPAGVKVTRVGSTRELRDAVLAAARDADAVVMAAAPADFRPAAYADAKIKKADDGSAPTVELTQNPDILAELSQARPRPAWWWPASPPRPATPPGESSTTAGPSWHARAATCSWSTRWVRARGSRAPTTRRSSWARTAPRPRCRAAPRKRSRTGSGTSWQPAWGLAYPPPCRVADSPRSPAGPAAPAFMGVPSSSACPACHAPARPVDPG